MPYIYVEMVPRFRLLLGFNATQLYACNHTRRRNCIGQTHTTPRSLDGLQVGVQDARRLGYCLWPPYA